jgi:hypothetical protein
LTTLSSHAFPSVCRLALHIALKLLMPDAGIKYPELDQGGRFSVWRNFFELAGCCVGSSDEEFDTLEDEVAIIAPEDVQASLRTTLEHSIDVHEGGWIDMSSVMRYSVVDKSKKTGEQEDRRARRQESGWRRRAKR